jgi:hypothetical protein
MQRCFFILYSEYNWVYECQLALPRPQEVRAASGSRRRLQIPGEIRTISQALDQVAMLSFEKRLSCSL